ncbi:MAG: DegT/DnrJ/EryC1/StrS family aminotransferase, partial [Gemmatimonadota bacterium]|nr:DegT/DnrJ/EryC1/StrS family aminotransferase [Gemmatimonadota bacterium]
MRQRLTERFGAQAVALTDSGTSALVLALRLAAGAGGTVAFPGYACIDLAAAARFAGVRVRLYDVDPASLSPDLDSVRRTL